MFIKYNTLEALKEDIEDPENSSILEHIQQNNIDTMFFNTFCEKVRGIDNPQGTVENTDEWSEILERMKESPEFTEQIYEKTVEYFRQEQV